MWDEGEDRTHRMSQRRYYVLSAQGEIGPHNRLEIRDLLHAGDIAEDDLLRTAAGTNAGSVIELLNQPEESSSYRLHTVDVVEPAQAPAGGRRRGPRSRGVTEAESDAVSSASSGPRSLPIVTIALSVTLLVLLSGWWWLSSGQRHRDAEQSSAVAAMPVVTITGEDGSWVLGRDATMIIRTAQPVTNTLTVPLDLSGSAVPGVDFTPIVNQVEILAGTDEARVTCVPLPVTNTRQPAVTVAVAIAPRPGYQIGDARRVVVVLQPEAALATAAAGSPQVTWVGDMPFVDQWSADHAPDRNQSYDARVQVIDHVSFPKGLAIHPGDHARDPQAHATFALEGKFKEFLATIGLDDEIRNRPDPSVTFQVWVDDQPQFDSGVMRPTTPARNIRINVTGAKTLRLVVTDAGDGNTCDHADWGAARLIR